MKSKTIWLTGSRGFIGKHLVQVLKEARFQIKCFTNNPAAETETQNREQDCFFMDYLSETDIKRQVDLLGLPDIFIHLGWADMPKPESELHLSENVKAGKTLIDTLFKGGLKKFLFIGSMNEYGGRVGLLSENMEPQGRLTNYAKGKTKVAEFGFQSAKLYEKTFIHIRLFYVFGPGQRKGSLINELYQAYLQGTDAKLGPCEQYRDYIHVLDAAEGIYRISNVNESTTVNLGSGTFIKVKDFVILFWKLLGADMERLKFGACSMREGEPEQPRSYADLARLKKLTNWLPLRSIEDGIKITIEKLNRLH